jgi:hypothetical protein
MPVPLSSYKSLNTQRVRQHLALDLPEIPPEVLQADVLTLAMIAEAWLSSEERTDQSGKYHEPAANGS